LFGNKSTNTRKGRFSDGISIYYKQYLKDKIKIIEKHQNGIVWIKLCKTLFDFEEDVYFCNTYIIPTNSRVIDQHDFDFFEQIEIGIEKYKLHGKIFCCGDLNARTPNVPDTLNSDVYLDQNANFTLNTNHLPVRSNRDHMVKIDSHGQQLINLCKSTSIIIGNGRLHSDFNVGEFTFH
jgi:hypothetical protein